MAPTLLQPRQRRLTLARLFKATGIKFSVGAREALECGGFDAAFPFLDLSTAQSKESGVKAKALQRLPPILMSKLNASALLTPICAGALRAVKRSPGIQIIL